MTHNNTKLEIVWRNPQRVCTSRRRDTFVREASRVCTFWKSSLATNIWGTGAPYLI